MVDLSRGFTVFKQGAEARLHRGTFLDLKAVAKERFPKKYRHPQLDRQLTRDRVKGEARSLVRAKMLGVLTPTVFLADLESGVIVMEDLGETTVTARDYIKGITEEKGSDDERLLALGGEIGRTVAKLHCGGVIHGDLTTSNILVETSSSGGSCPRLVMIDFGLGFAEGSPEDKGVDLYVLERALLSTHPNTEALFKAILEGYEKETKSSSGGGGRKVCHEVLAKFEDVRMRGRKRTMVG